MTEVNKLFLQAFDQEEMQSVQHYPVNEAIAKLKWQVL